MARRPLFFVVLGALPLAVACMAPGGPDRITSSQFPGTTPIDTGPIDAGVGDVGQRMLTCMPLTSSEPLPPRSTLTAGVQSAPTQPTYFTSDLFALFKSVCGGCHVDSNLGMFQVSSTTFSSKVNEMVYGILTSDDPTVFMPPVGYPGAVPYTQRLSKGGTDPVMLLATLIRAWLDQGSPDDAFTPPLADGGTSQQTTTGYAMSAALGKQLTNIGSCVPGKDMVGTDATTMKDLDTFFANATSLPPTLDKTDLVSLDSDVLARSGVISYAPTYPLWTDGAGKMRYVRVPVGQSIVFDKPTQQFHIPANTRFYKTFLKAVVDANGNATNRKIETRVIVSRPDTSLTDGTIVQNALYGTYVWNDDESQATLLTDPLRSGNPFADRIFVYVTDETKAAKITASKPQDLALSLQQAGVTRHYALPGGERCVQCHQGSPSQSFVLGFTPLQVARRAANTGGVYEQPAGDELTQLQRLMDYGIITGLASPDDLSPLEKSQGTRTPRTPQELAAQAYMIGNCAHCHNPRGYPSTKQPALKGVLDFLPGTAAGQGIFDFPLELTSPIRERGLTQNIPIPYITPSLYDMPRGEALSKFFCPAQPNASCTDPSSRFTWVLAPWRSLIYRNTDTPYDYFDDYAAFPHMPLNSPGYDPRTTQIMGDWMVSIPAVIKDPTKIESAIPSFAANQGTWIFGPKANSDIQPYMEVKPGDKGYAQALLDAQARLDAYHHAQNTTATFDPGDRYHFLPKTYTEDIVDPVIQNEVDQNMPVLTDDGPVLDNSDPMNPDKVIMPQLTPLRPDYVSFDDTEPPGDWFPRRPDWATALVNPDVATFVSDAVISDYLTDDAAEDLTNVLNALATVSITDTVRTELTKAVPFGLWDTSDSTCNFKGIPTASSFTGADRPQWMGVAPPKPDAPVYVESAGAAVFTTICFNCHGQLADSKGLLADEITSLTGGDARVADFRDGLFGPLAQPGSNRSRVFGPAAAMLGLTAEDLSARYLSWMALGGTEKHLPEAVLTQVSESPVLGTIRGHISLVGTPDMLKLGLQICEQVATSSVDVDSLSLQGLFATGWIGWGAQTGLIDQNGDAEMWLRLCNLGNRPIVRVATVAGGQWTVSAGVSDLNALGGRLFWATDDKGNDLYGANPVMDQLGNIETGVTSDNLFPLCVEKPTQSDISDQFFKAHPIKGNAIPYCPPGFVQASNQLKVTGTANDTDFVDGRKWAARGAINAALAVYLYVDQIERQSASRLPLYNQCELLGSTQ